MNINEEPPEWFELSEGFWRCCVELVARGADYTTYVDAVKLAYGQLSAEVREGGLAGGALHGACDVASNAAFGGWLWSREAAGDRAQ